MSESTRIILEKNNRLWHWSIQVNGEDHKGERPMPTAEIAANEAQRMLSALWWQNNRAKADNGASLDIHEYVRPRKEIKPLEIGRNSEARA